MLEMVDRAVLFLLVSIIVIGGAATHLASCACSSSDDWAIEREARASAREQKHREWREEMRQKQEQWDREFEAKMKAPPTPPPREPYDLLDERHQNLVDNILKMSPRAGKNRAVNIAKLIISHSDFSKIPHENFVAAIIQRESNYAQRVEDGRRRGLRGEIGLMQVMPRGYAIRTFGNECEQTDAACNIMTGTRYLEVAREKCLEERETDDPWVWMSAYGSGKCPSPRSARTHKSAKKARRIFCKITPDCEEHWPL